MPPGNRQIASPLRQEGTAGRAHRRPHMNDPLRDRLLGRIPQPCDVAAYRANVKEIVERKQKSMARESIAVKAFWIFCALSATAWLWFSAESAQLPRAPFLAILFFVWGGVEVVTHQINRSQ